MFGLIIIWWVLTEMAAPPIVWAMYGLWVMLYVITLILKVIGWALKEWR